VLTIIKKARFPFDFAFNVCSLAFIPHYSFVPLTYLSPLTTEFIELLSQEAELRSSNFIISLTLLHRELDLGYLFEVTSQYVLFYSSIQ
jgi:hypothetical protein